MNKLGPQTLVRSVPYLVLIIGLPLLAWWMWRPLGSFLAILVSGQIKYPLSRRNFARSTPATLVLSVLMGILMAVFVWFLYTSAAVDTTWARLFFCIVGFWPVAYIDSGIEDWISPQRRSSDLHPSVAVISYAVTSVLIWGEKI